MVIENLEIHCIEMIYKVVTYCYGGRFSNTPSSSKRGIGCRSNIDMRPIKLL